MILSTQNGLFKFKYLLHNLMDEIVRISQYRARSQKSADGKLNNIEDGAIDEEDRRLLENFIRQGATRAYEVLMFLVSGVVLPTTPGAKQKEVITLLGISGTANIAFTAGLTRLVTFVDTLANAATAFATANATAYAAYDIALSASGDTLIFESTVPGQPFVAPVISVVTGSLSGSVNHAVANVCRTTRAFSWREAGTESAGGVVITIGQKDWMAETIELEINDKILEVVKEYALREWYIATGQDADTKLHTDKYNVALMELHNAAHKRKKITTTINPL